MNNATTKKLMLLNILDILKRYSDEDHRLSQKDISDILRDEYGMTANRKTVKRDLMELMEFGYELDFTETVRSQPVKNKETGEVIGMEENSIMSDFYLKRDFTDSELRLLIDSLLFSSHIPMNHRRELIAKLERLASIYFKSKVKHIVSYSSAVNYNRQLFYTIDVLEEAISTDRQVSFTYCEYGTDKKLHRRCRPDGTVREYIINPYQMVTKEGKYYLICNYDKYNGVSNYRIDRIADIRLLETPAKPFSELDGAEMGGLDLQKYMAEHIYMYASDNVRVKFRITRAMISDVIDIFGDGVSFSDETADAVTVSAYVNEMAMVRFAKTYAPDVVILSPAELAQKVIDDTEKTLRLYGESRGNCTE